jgi:predicted RNase H-like nuclease
MIVAGADAARIGKRAGWAVVVLREDGSADFRLEPDLERVLSEVELLAADVPIGLADEGVPLDERGRRVADVEARSILGQRANTVFWAPPLEAIECHTYSGALTRYNRRVLMGERN